MTQENKELLLRDLCSRLPYGVKCRQFKLDSQVCTLIPVLLEKVENIEPYLRPMSSMTEEEKAFYEYHKEGHCSSGWATTLVDWLIKNHFDYRDLILKGLALPSPEGMYHEK